MKCPADSNALRSIFSEEMKVEIDTCDTCKGVWFDADELAKAASYLRMTLPEKKGKAAFSAHVEDTHRYHPPNEYNCPKDAVKMIEHMYAGDSGIFINQCDTCLGFWFDGGELDKLKNYLAPSPLEDTVGKAMADEMTAEERSKRELAQFIGQLLGATSSPINLIIFLTSAILRHIMNKANSESPEKDVIRDRQVL